MKKFLSLFFSVALILSLCFVTTGCGDTTVAKIGETNYTSLALAINSASAGDEIVVVNDSTDDCVYNITKAITIKGSVQSGKLPKVYGNFVVNISNAGGVATISNLEIVQNSSVAVTDFNSSIENYNGIVEQNAITILNGGATITNNKIHTDYILQGNTGDYISPNGIFVSRSKDSVSTKKVTIENNTFGSYASYSKNYGTFSTAIFMVENLYGTFADLDNVLSSTTIEGNTTFDVYNTSKNTFASGSQYYVLRKDLGSSSDTDGKEVSTNVGTVFAVVGQTGALSLALKSQSKNADIVVRDSIAIDDTFLSLYVNPTTTLEISNGANLSGQNNNGNYSLNVFGEIKISALDSLKKINLICGTGNNAGTVTLNDGINTATSYTPSTTATAVTNSDQVVICTSSDTSVTYSNEYNYIQSLLASYSDVRYSYSVENGKTKVNMKTIPDYSFIYSNGTNYSLESRSSLTEINTNVDTDLYKIPVKDNDGNYINGFRAKDTTNLGSTLNLVGLGDSFMYGVGSDDPNTDSFLALIGSYLAYQMPNVNVTTNNLGIDGMNTFGLLFQLYYDKYYETIDGYNVYRDNIYNDKKVSVIQSVIDADIIEISIGGNDGLLEIVQKILDNVDIDYAALANASDANAQSTAFFEQINYGELLAIDFSTLINDDGSSSVVESGSTISNAEACMALNYALIIKRIQELNPTCKIVAVSTVNPFSFMQSMLSTIEGYLSLIVSNTVSKYVADAIVATLMNYLSELGIDAQAFLSDYGVIDENGNIDLIKVRELLNHINSLITVCQYGVTQVESAMTLNCTNELTNYQATEGNSSATVVPVATRTFEFVNIAPDFGTAVGMITYTGMLNADPHPTNEGYKKIFELHQLHDEGGFLDDYITATTSTGGRYYVVEGSGGSGEGTGEGSSETNNTAAEQEIRLNNFMNLKNKFKIDITINLLGH